MCTAVLSTVEDNAPKLKQEISSPVAIEEVKRASKVKHKVRDKVKKINKTNKTGDKKPRSRFGCEECKAKRVKCDEIKPKCTRCVQKRTACSYRIVLQFREDLEEKGRKFGREGVWSKNEENGKVSSTQLSCKSQDSYYLEIKRQQLKFINVFFADILESRRTRIMPCLNSGIVPVDILNSNEGDFSSVSFALNYYIAFISPILNPLGEESAYYKQVSSSATKYIQIERGLDLGSLMQYSQSQDHLFYLMLSLGSKYLSKISDETNSFQREWEVQSQKFRSLAIKNAPEDTQLALVSQDMTITEVIENPKTDSLLSFVFLILYELANDCNTRWTLYLKLCKRLLDSDHFYIPQNSLEFSLLKFCVEFLEYQEAIGRTACKDTNSFFLKYEDDGNALEKVHGGDNQKIQLVSWMGCDRKLLSILQDITDFSSERDNNISESYYIAFCDGIRQRIDALSLHLLDGLIERANSEETDDYWSFMDSQIDLLTSNDMTEEFCFLVACEVKRLAALVYFEACLLSKTPEDVVIQRWVRVIFKVLEILVLKHEYQWYSIIIWPVYIASCEISSLSSDCEELRYLSVALLEKIEQVSLGNVNKTRSIILEIWKRRDLKGADENSFGMAKKKANKGLLGYDNDWDIFVVDKNCCLSMA